MGLFKIEITKEELESRIAQIRSYKDPEELAFEDSLKERFPIMYHRMYDCNHLDYQDPIQDRGLEIPKELFPALETFSEKVEALNAGIYIIQIKTKFGYFTIYAGGTSNLTDEQREVFNRAHQEAVETGNPIIAELSAKSGRII